MTVHTLDAESWTESFVDDLMALLIDIVEDIKTARVIGDVRVPSCHHVHATLFRGCSVDELKVFDCVVDNTRNAEPVCMALLPVGLL